MACTENSGERHLMPCPTATITTARVPVTETYRFDNWTISITKGPILSSQCICLKPSSVPASPVPLDTGVSHLGTSISAKIGEKCAFCRCEPLLKLKYLPDMVFAENRLRIESHTGDFGLEYNAIDAINSIAEHSSGNIQVASAGAWQEARIEALKTYGSKTVEYDWTFTPNYRGHVFGDGIVVETTDEQLDMEMLKRKDPVLLFKELQLYGDELDDNGCAELDVKIRIVESYLFVLMRFYLRIDHVFVRLHDTRLVFQKGKPYMLREFAVRETKISDLPKNVSAMEPMQLWSELNPIKVDHEKLLIKSVH